MTGLTNLVGVLLNCGMIPSGDTRIVKAVGSSGLDISAGALKKYLDLGNGRHFAKNVDVKSGANTFNSLFKIIIRTLGIGRQNYSSSGVKVPSAVDNFMRRLSGVRSGNADPSISHGGEVMALLVILVFQAFKNIDRQPEGMRSAIGGNEILLGLRAPVNVEEEKELELTATLVLKGMIMAAKADSQIGYEGIQKIIGRIRESNSDADIQHLIFEEMQQPLNLDSLVNEIPNEAVAAQVYAASLFAIEVDTAVQREYLEQFVRRTGLDVGVAQQLQTAIGVG